MAFRPLQLQCIREKLVFDWIGTALNIVAKLRHHGTRGKCDLVLMTVVAPWLFQAIKAFDITINRLVPSASGSLCLNVSFIEKDMFVATGIITPIAKVTFHHFTRGQQLLQVSSKDTQVRPSSTLEWTINPTDITRLNTDPNLIAKSSALVLLHKPFLAKWTWLLDWAVGAIDRHLTSPATVIPKAVLQTDL